ncbi:MAG TPA: hypothetical protein VFC78_23535 [Tepidisphaeraceae bacterium]|nr:hypothetical protein [Tepidisphaeraceae bacterium]
MMKWPFLVAALFLSLGQLAFAQVRPVAGPPPIKAGDKAALAAATNRQATVIGEVSSAQWNSTGKVFLIKFKDTLSSDFQAAIFAKNKSAMEKAFKGDLSAVFNGATLQITGRVQTYRDHPEIMVSEPTQIAILARGGGPVAAAAPPSSAVGKNAIEPTGIYAQLTLTDAQRRRIAAIQKEADLKIERLLTAAQRKQLAELKDQAKEAPAKDAEKMK